MNTPATPIVIGNTEISPLFYQNQPVITLVMMDKVHGRPDGTARRNFNEHKEKLIVGEDYFQLSQTDMQAMDEFRTSANPKGLTILTETGYLLLVKSFTDELAWQIQRQLVKAYFSVKRQVPQQHQADETLTAQDQHNIKRIIWDIARFQRYESGWVQGVWFAIRKRTNNPSPRPFTVDHLPLIAEELRRVLNAAEKLRDHTRKLEQEVLKTIIRGGGRIDMIIAREEADQAATLAEMTQGATSVLDGWQIRELNAVVARTALPGSGDYRGMSET